MLFKRGLLRLKTFLSALKSPSFKLHNKNNAHLFSSYFARISPAMVLLASTIIHCASDLNENDPQIHQITKQELVQFIHKDNTHDFVVIVYDKFKRMNVKQFGEELKPIIDQCKIAKVDKIYLIDSKQKDHLNQIIKILRNQSTSNQQEEIQEKQSKKSFEIYFKSKFFSEAIELQDLQQQSISKQIEQIHRYQFNANNQKINETLVNHINNPWDINKTYIVKQCMSQGECTQSYKREIKKLIDGGMMRGKSNEYKFELIIDQPTGILSSSSEYVKNYVKGVEKLKQKSINLNKKQEIYAFRRDLFGSEIALYSQWLDKQGLNYGANDRFLMFIKPRINIITKANTLTDLMWYLRTAKLNNQVSFSLNNIPRFANSNSKQSCEVLKILHESFPNLNYLIINSQKIRELIRHVNADQKYVIFKQDSSIIWNKQFLNLDKMEILTSKSQKKKVFIDQYKQKISDFIDNPQIKSLVEVQRQLQINLQKLNILRERQLKKLNLRKYVIRVCQQHCHRYLDRQTVDEINAKVEGPVNVYWIDSTAQNIGVENGNYILKDGQLSRVQQFLQSCSPTI